MTKQDMLMQEEAAVAVVAVAAVPEACPHFSYPPPRSTTFGARYCRYKKLMVSRLDLVGGGGANSLTETMKALSPTRAKPRDDADLDGWLKLHPSALSNFEELMSAAKGKQIVMFLDYDGTLSPIVDDPDRAFMSDEMREAVREVASHFPTAIVSGRCTDKVSSFVKLSELYYAGSHGMDIKGPNINGPKHSTVKKQARNVLFQPASEFLPMIDEVYKYLVEATKSIPGSKVENNKFCLSVHFRCVDEKKWSLLADKVQAVIMDYPKLRLTHGRKVLEIRPTIKWDKGKALEFLLESLGLDGYNNAFPLYVGDDRTDEDAFKVLRDRGQGFGILVSKMAKETAASFSLKDPAENNCRFTSSCVASWSGSKDADEFSASHPTSIYRWIGAVLMDDFFSMIKLN